MKIQILGPGCPNCEKLAELATTAATELGLSFELEKVTDLNAIISFGVFSTPALALDGTVKFVGNVPSVEELKAYLTS